MKAKWSTFFILAIFGLSACLNDGGDPNAALNAETKLIDEHLASTGVSPNRILYDNSRGIRFVVDTYGNDAPPQVGQRVKITYSGRLFSDGTPFSGGILEDDLEDIVPEGLKTTLAAMLKGTEARIYIPSKYGYGETGTATVPPNSILVYDVILDDVMRTPTQLERFKADTAAINTYIEENIEGTVVQHASGIRFTVDEVGGGSHPTPYSIVDFEYELRQLTGTGPGAVLDQGTLTDYAVFGLIDGMKIALPLIGEGTTATFYFPSILGYGTQGSQGVPANANLVFEVKLTDVR